MWPYGSGVGWPRLGPPEPGRENIPWPTLLGLSALAWLFVRPGRANCTEGQIATMLGLRPGPPAFLEHRENTTYVEFIPRLESEQVHRMVTKSPLGPPWHLSSPGAPLFEHFPTMRGRLQRRPQNSLISIDQQIHMAGVPTLLCRALAESLDCMKGCTRGRSVDSTPSERAGRAIGAEPGEFIQ